MFWSGNYIAVREINFLLKEENVSLTQVLEADDILPECKADNKALVQFLTKPEVLAELITLITEEPPQNVELAMQYRHASIACEVLTSQLSTLADRLSLDTVQMNRLCDFINREPPLNPLLASYFSKTVEMLLERSPKQDWYLYHIVCLRVLDFFRSRRDFLPNLLRHAATSAIADTFKHLLRLDDLFNKIVMEWLDEHQFLESLIQIICGSYVPEPVQPRDAAPASEPPQTELNHNEGEANKEEKPVENSLPAPAQPPPGPDADNMAAEKWRAVAAANAAALLCDLILNGCAGEGCTTRLRTVWVLVSRLQSEEWVRALLAGMFTSPAPARHTAIVHGCLVLLALLSTDPILGGGGAAERSSVELAVAPHLPLLHQALLTPQHEGGGVGGRGAGAVGAARIHVAGLLAQLALSEVEDVSTTMLTLGTPGTLVDMFFRHPDNNFLHAQVYALVKHALSNKAYCTRYAQHLLIECDLLTRLMDVYEENEEKRPGVPRAGYMGHVVLLLRRCAHALSAGDGALLQALAPGDALAARWAAFTDPARPFAQRAHRHDTPLGGYYPSENIYEVENMAELTDSIEATYDFNDTAGNSLDELGDEVNIDTRHEFDDLASAERQQREREQFLAETSEARNTFLELARQRFDDDMWDDSPDEEGDAGAGAGSQHDVQDVLAAVAPWESAPEEAWESAPEEAWESKRGSADDDWAQFSSAPAQPPIDPFAPPGGDFAPFWPSTDDTSDIPDDIMRLSQFSISATFPDQIESSNDNVVKGINFDNANLGITPANDLAENASNLATVDINAANLVITAATNNVANIASTNNVSNLQTEDIITGDASTDRAARTEIKADIDKSSVSDSDTNETTDNSASNQSNSDVTKSTTNLDVDNDNTIKVANSAEVTVTSENAAASADNVTTKCETSIEVAESADRSDS